MRRWAIGFFRNLRFLQDGFVMTLSALLMSWHVHCAARKRHASPSSKKFGFKRSLICLIWLFPILSFAASDQTQQFILPNGLKLIVCEDHRSPLVLSSVWYKVGGSYEEDGYTGISHVLEHMMFKGTKLHPPGDLIRIVSDNGGQQNAMTVYDYTVYYQLLAADKLPISFELEADRMQSLLLNQQLFQKELQVVMEERRMRIDDDPRQVTLERFYAAAFINNPYHHPVIGWVPDIQHITLDNLKDWYHKWYAPNNAEVIVVGDVNAQQVYQLALKYFGPLKAANIPSVKPQTEVPALGSRLIIVKIPAKLPWLVEGFNTPVLNGEEQSWQPYALDVAAYILGGGDSSRFSQDLIRGRQIATDASADYSPFQLHDALFTLNATPAPGYDVEVLRLAFDDEIKKLQTTLVSNDELARVKAQIIAQNIYQKDAPINEAFSLGVPEMVGLSWRASDDLVKHIEAVTPQQIQTVAQEYLVPSQLTVAILQPAK